MKVCAKALQPSFDQSDCQPSYSPRPQNFCRLSYRKLRVAWCCVRLPGLSGLEFQADLAKANIQIPIVFMTGHGDIPMTVRAMKAGAVEFLTKPFRDQDMLDAVQLAIEQDRSRRKDESANRQLKASFDTLTSRERQIMSLVAVGLMNKQIAGEVGLTEVTVKLHRGNVMRKMAAKSVAELVRMADLLGVRRETA
jgi:FixJ family two-component response regulator